MNDRERVIKGLACCIESYDKGFCPDECEYRGTYPDCEQGLMREARELLKEQEPIQMKEQEPIQMKVLEDYGSIKFGYCPKCKSLINNRSYPKSCGCGQAVKWDEHP